MASARSGFESATSIAVCRESRPNKVKNQGAPAAMNLWSGWSCSASRSPSRSAALLASSLSSSGSAELGRSTGRPVGRTKGAAASFIASSRVANASPPGGTSRSQVIVMVSPSCCTVPEVVRVAKVCSSRQCQPEGAGASALGVAVPPALTASIGVASRVSSACSLTCWAVVAADSIAITSASPAAVRLRSRFIVNTGSAPRPGVRSTDRNAPEPPLAEAPTAAASCERTRSSRRDSTRSSPQ